MKKGRSKVVQRREFLKLLGSSAQTKHRNALIDIATSDEICALIEACHNLLRNKKVKISKKDKDKLKRYKNHIRAIANKRKGSLNNKRLILKQHGGFLPVALPLILSSLTGLAGSLLRNR